MKVASLVVTPKSQDSDLRQAIQLQNVGISFRIAPDRTYEVLKNISFQASEHEFVAIVGPTGCGKSTILNAIAGLLKPSEGEVSIFGKPSAGTNTRAGYLFQQDSLMPWKTALENVAVGLEVTGVAPGEARERAAGWLDKVGLSSFLDRYPHMLSGGQRKRVGLAQVLIRDPKILLMDEPFGPLDAQTRLIMSDLMLRLWSQDQKAVVFITHDLEEAIALADRVVILSAGPRSTIIGNYPVGLKRPRDLVEVKHEPLFREIHREIWNSLKDEVLKGYRQTAGVIG